MSTPDTRPGSPLSAPGRRDLWITVAALVVVLAWDLSGLDLTVSSWYGNSAGFALRDAWWTSRLVHDGGRLVAALVLLAMLVDAARPMLLPPPRGPERSRRWLWIAATLVCLLLIPGIKRISATSCPWDLSLFGGVAQHLSHWRWGVPDGAGGHCFPSGHAVAAFAFFSLHFLWRAHRPALARAALLAVLLVGALFGWVQMVRGAHFISHTLWSAWLCWLVCVTWAAGLRQLSPTP